MATRIGASAFDERFVLPDWEILRHRIEAQFVAYDFCSALLAYREVPPVQPGWPIEDLVDPLGFGPDVWFQQMDVCTWQDRD
jgi:hypothetical protein